MLVVKNPPANKKDVRDSGLISGLGRSPGGGHGNPLCILAWRIPWIEELGGLQSIGSQRVGYDWSDVKMLVWSLDIFIKVNILSKGTCLLRGLELSALPHRPALWWAGMWKGGSGWGTHVNPWLIHINVWQKPLQYCKVISLQLK